MENINSKKAVLLKSARYTSMGLKVGLLSALALPVGLSTLAKLFGGNIPGFLINGAAVVMLGMSIALSYRALTIDLEEIERLIPLEHGAWRRWLAPLLTGGATALTALSYDKNVPEFGLLVGFSIAATLGHWFWLGSGVKSSVVNTAGSGVDAVELQKALNASQQLIVSMQKSANRVNDPALQQKILQIASKAETITALVKDKPARFNGARKFFATYLQSVEKVTTTYADNKTIGVVQSENRQEFSDLLDTLLGNLDQQEQRILSNDALDLDVQIEVLNQQLKQDSGQLIK